MPNRFCTGLDAALTSITPWLRIPLLTVRDIMKVVKPSGIVASEQWLEALDYLAAPTDGDRPPPPLSVQLDLLVHNLIC